MSKKAAKHAAAKKVVPARKSAAGPGLASGDFDLLMGALNRIAIALERLAVREQEGETSEDNLVAAAVGRIAVNFAGAGGQLMAAAAAAAAAPACTPAGIAALKAANRTMVGGQTRITIQQTSRRMRQMLICETGFDPLSIEPNAPLPPVVGPDVRTSLRPVINGVYYNDVNSQVGEGALHNAGTPSALLGAIWAGIVNKHP